MAVAKAKKQAPRAAKKDKPGLEIGDTGTRFLSGIISEEYNPKLIGQRGFAVCDEMRKSDGTVRAAVQAVTLPIRAANWYVKPASEQQADQDIAVFVQNSARSPDPSPRSARRLFEYMTSASLTSCVRCSSMPARSRRRTPTKRTSES
jgi:hypothetical protein